MIPMVDVSGDVIIPSPLKRGIIGLLKTFGITFV